MRQKPNHDGLSEVVRRAGRIGVQCLSFWTLLVATTLALIGSAQAAALSVSMMPSFTQSPTYANAKLNDATFQVWGRVIGGSGTYTTYSIDFGDGSAVVTGNVNNGATTFQIGGPDFLQATHAFTTGGSKTVKLTVSDSAGATATGTAVVRVLVSPTHDDNVNMAIEKGLIYLYRNQGRVASGANQVSYWYQNGGEAGNAAAAAAVLSFAENGHLASNDPIADVYTETVKRGIYYIVTRGRNMAISAQAGGNPDLNGNGRGIYFDDTQSYPHGFQVAALVNAFPNLATAAAATIPAGLWQGGGIVPATFKDFVEDALEQLYYNQGDTGFKGWHYSMNVADSGGGAFDGSTHQWPNIAILSAKERWGETPPQWVINNSVFAYQQGTDHSGGTFDGGVGYSGNNSWRNVAKTSGSLVGYALAGKLIGADADADRSFKFIKNFYLSTIDYGSDGGGWLADFYAMFAMKKGLTLQGVTSLPASDGYTHDWYKELSGWLLGDANVLYNAANYPPAPTLLTAAAATSISSLTFEFLDTCGTSTYTFYLNGVPIGSGAANPSGGCTCTPSLSSFTINNAALLANWIPGAANNAIRIDVNGGVLVAWARVVIKSGTSAQLAYLINGNNGAGLNGEMNLCTAGYRSVSGQSFVNSTLFATPLAPTSGPGIGLSKRTLNNAFGQAADGSWDASGTSGFVNGYGAALGTPHAILILTKAVTKPLPVAVIATPIADQSARNPAPFSLDGSGSYHLDPNSSLTEYLWILDPPANPDWSHPTASGPKPTVNPGWNAVGTHTIMLRVADNQNPVNYATATATVNVTLADVAPVAVPMPPSRVPQIYTGNIGDTIVLDGSASFDVDGDAIASYAWDLNGDGQYGTAADIALDTSGNNAVGATASVVFSSTHSGQVGLKVGSFPHDANGNIVGPIKYGVSTKPVDIYASPNDLYVSSLTVANLNPTVSGNVTVVVSSQAGSTALNNVVVRFYNADPLTGGAQIGANFTVNVPAGGSATLTVPNFAFGGAQTLWAFADANNAVSEYDETNNTKSANVANQPPTAGFGVVGAIQCNDALTLSVNVADPDNDPITVTWTVDGSVFATHTTASGATSDSITKVFGFGSHTVSVSVTDSKSAAVVTSTSFTIADTIAPTIATLSNLTQTADAGTCGAVVSYGLPDAADNCGVVSVVNVPASGSTFPIGVTTVTSTATDAAGNIATSTFTVTVTDNEAPVIAKNADISVTADAGSPGAIVTYSNPSATDNCPGVTVSSSPASGSLFPIGVTTVTSTATDAAGNTSTSTFTVTVTDTEAPVVATNPSVNANIDAGSCGAVVTFTLPTASDNSGSVTVVADPASGSTFPVGTTTVTVTATDASGNKSTSTFTVTVKDNEAPKIGQNANISVTNDAGQCGAVVTSAQPTVSDNCPGVSVVSTPASGSTFPVGVTTVTSTATDAAGNTATSTFTVTVTDSEKPTIGKNANIVVSNDAGKCGAVVTYGLPTASDNCAIATVVNNPASGSTFPIGTTTVVSTATDTAGNGISSSFTVTVKDTEKPTIGTNANIVQGTDPGQCGAVVKYGLPAAADNCGVVSVVNNPPSGSVFPVGVTTVTSTATDAAGNFITSSFTVTVKDTEAPKIVAPADFTIEFTNENGAVGTYAAPVVTDNCPGVTYTVSKASGTVFPIGLTTVTITATDKAGNVTTATFTLRVLGANGVKLNILAEMKAKNVKLTGKWGKDDDDCHGVLSEAIEELTESLKRENWVDQTHLSCKRGDDAINEERQAVNDLVKLLASKSNPIAPAILQDWINRITACDRLLAVVAINDAVAAKTSASIIAKARAELAAGDADIASTKGGKYNSGINHYANAWDFATSLTCKDGGKGYEDHDECKGSKDDDRDDDGHRKCGR